MERNPAQPRCWSISRAEEGNIMDIISPFDLALLASLPFMTGIAVGFVIRSLMFYSRNRIRD